MARHTDIDFRIKEEKERRAFGEPFNPADAIPAAQRAIWNLADRLEAIDAAERALTNGCGSFERYCHIATLGGLVPEQARADAQAAYARSYSAAVQAERLAA